ncbi:MAG: hypothetical protein CL911_04890 [Deltaproteobacteria bacterium]|nr:hypothetical protein [Deltaproteobacteria bacterium]
MVRKMRSYIIRRLMHARNMLLDRSDNIDQISAAVGYTDPGYFCRMFKRYENIKVAGYNAFFTLLNKLLRDGLIARTEHRL